MRTITKILTVIAYLLFFIFGVIGSFIILIGICYAVVMFIAEVFYNLIK